MKKRYLPGMVSTKLGVLEYGDSTSFLSGINEIFIDEIYKVNKFKNENPLIIDCGANIGLSTIYFSRMYNANVQAYEADPCIYQHLVNNVENICPLGNITPYNKAIWINEEGVEFDVEGGYSGQIHQHGHDLIKEIIKIPSVGLRRLITDAGKVDLLKLDIEGAENRVLLECEDVLRYIDYIFIEWHSITKGEQNLGEILTMLKKEGFRYHVKEAFSSTHPFVELKEMCGMDSQLNIFAYK